MGPGRRTQALRRLTSIPRRALAGVLLALPLATPAVAQVPMYGPGGAFWGYPHLYGGPCVAPCDPRELRRELRRELQRQESATTTPAAKPETRPPPPPTRVEEIRPEFEGASQIREEFRRSGERR